MEIHAPEEPIYTWKQFWIHLGTITVGLCIALGMEQGVEWLHRVHERHALQRELREEGEHNEATLTMDFRRIATLKGSLVQWHRGVDEAIAKGESLNDSSSHRANTGTVALPSEAMWDSAKATGRVGLLSDAQTAVYAFLYQQGERLRAQEWDMANVAVQKQELERRFERNFEETGNDGVPDYSKMNAEDLKSYSTVLNREIAELDEMTELLHYFDEVNREVLDGADSQEEILRRIDAKKMKKM
jgi:hypothetical protein